ncbi:MAG: hypothetical protein ABFS86_00930 [Planctomycetota bacterium]
MPRSFLSFALVVIVATSMVACASSPSKPTPPEKADSGMEVAKGTTTTDMPDSDEPQAPPRPSFTTDEYINKMMAEGQPSAEPPPDVVPAAGTAAVGMDGLAEKKKVEGEATEALVDYYIEQAERNKKELKYDEALVWVKKALGESPGDQRAGDLYKEILAAQGKRAGVIPHEMAELQARNRVQQEEARVQANYYFNEGKKGFHEERFDAAIDNFENVLTIINNAPYGTEWGTLRSETEEFLFQSREGKLRADEAAMAEAARMALDTVKQDEAKRRMEQQERIDKLLTEGLSAFESERFGVAESFAEQVLDLDPRNARALELRDQSVRARYRHSSDELLQTQKERFREWRLDIAETAIPWSDRPLHWPSQREWDRINRRAAKVTDFGGGTEMSPEDRALSNRLREEKIGFTFDETPLPEAIEFIRGVKNLNIVIDGEIESDLEGAPVSLSVNELELSAALNLLLKLAGPEYTYTLKNGVVYITNQEGARGEATLRVHPVGDLTIQLTNFIAPDLVLKPAGAEASEDQPPFGKAEEGEKIIGGGAEELMDLIMQNIEPDSWEEGYSCTTSGEDKLVVMHTPEVQAEVARFLDDLRKFAGLVVTIESRFLEVADDFLQDVGVDFLGLGGEGQSTLVNLDDVTNGLEDNASLGYDNTGGRSAGPSAGNPSAGVFFNNNSDGDYRGRTENIFDSALGKVLSPVGGAVVQYTFLDDTEVSMVLRAVEKSRSARILQAPSLTVYNTQRANITLVNQVSFIQDFDVEVAQTAFIADPIVSIIQDGLTLDVRPTISHDRKYIMLELQPTIATLLRPIPTFQTSLGALTTPVTMQLPETTIQKSQTTVRVPDGGSLVIGGLKDISFVDMTSETPWLGKIPIIGFFFSRKGSSKETNHLMIIVTATITDLAEEEERFRSPYVGVR